MSDKTYREHLDTEDIEDLIEQILRKISKPYPPDITDLVFCAIEGDEGLLHDYTIYASENV